jgi:hypothetical protein
VLNVCNLERSAALQVFVLCVHYSSNLRSLFAGYDIDVFRAIAREGSFGNPGGSRCGRMI